jgi:hypothetical protein
MQVVISNKSRLSSSPSRITVKNVNNVGRTTFGKIAKIGSVGLQDINNVNIDGQQDGDVLVYQANTSTYNIKTLPKIDGGAF